MVLAEKGVTVDIVDIVAGKEPEDLAELNPYNTRPTLADRDLALYEANVIMEYLDERFPHPPLLPVYPVQRALSRLWISRVEKEWSSRLDVLMLGKGRETILSKARKELRESIIAIAPIFAEKPFFMHEELSLVDCCVAPILWRLKEVDIALPERSTKPLHRYMLRGVKRNGF
jgi:RNA polymerase-associated protein